ncbi:unnamed protein product [Rhodiola kirilowii]
MAQVLLDPAFIQALEHRPNPAVTIDDDDLPVIDLSDVHDATSLASIVSQIGYACRTWGFFQVINHGVPGEVLENILLEAGKFFELPMEEKMKVVKVSGEKKLGFCLCEPDTVNGVKLWRHGFDYLITGYDEDEDLTNQWPQYPPDLRKRAMGFSVETEKLGLRIIELVSLSLGLPASKLREYFKPNTRRYSRLHHYPPCPSPHLAFGIGPHEDGGALTFLIQDKVGGLEVQRRADGEWIRVKPITNGYVVNVGHMMEAWTNGKYVSTMHRIKLSPDKGRLSCLLFFNPVYDTIIGPLEELIEGGSPNPKAYFRKLSTYLIARPAHNLMSLILKKTRFLGHVALNGSKISSLKNLAAYRHVERRGLFVVNVGASAGMSGDGKKVTFDDLKEKVREIWERCPQPVKMFPWNRAADNFIQLILDLFLAVVKYLSVPVLAVASVSELSYCAHERKLFFTPIPLVIGIFLAGVLKETLLDLSPLLREAEVEVPWHLIAIAAVFTLLKLPGPYYPYWGRIFIPHMANGALLRTLWFAFQWYRKPRKTSGVLHRSISTDVGNSKGEV